MKEKKSIIVHGTTTEDNFVVVRNIRLLELDEMFRVDMSTGENDWISIYDNEGNFIVKMDASRIAEFFRSKKQVYFDQTEDGEYICPECGQFYEENELWEYSYCKNCGVRIIE